MHNCFGSDDPEESCVLEGTFSQILSRSPIKISFLNYMDARLFCADVDWIGGGDELARMLAGAIKAYPRFGANSMRIETAYRYLYETVDYGKFSEIASIAKSKLGVSNMKELQDNDFVLILDKFGKYNWNEEKGYT